MKNVVAAYKEHGFLYVSQFDWGGVIWRPLSVAEAELYVGLFKTVPKAKADLEDEIFQDCVVDHPFPTDEKDQWSAGIVTTVAQQILFFSAIKAPNEFLQRLETVRSLVAGDIYTQMYARIMATFPGYTIEQLRNMSLDSVFQKLVLVELVTGEKLNLAQEEVPQTASGMINFSAENKKLHEVNAAPPKGDFNLDRMRNS
jgi:hypothetical protein